MSNHSNGAKDANYYIDWLERSISEEHLTYYKYSDFEDFQRIGRGSYGDVFRANWKKNRFYVLKSFNNDKIILKEIVNEVLNTFNCLKIFIQVKQIY
jgi:hypothetical protein